MSINLRICRFCLETKTLWFYLFRVNYFFKIKPSYYAFPFQM